MLIKKNIKSAFMLVVLLLFTDTTFSKNTIELNNNLKSISSYNFGKFYLEFDSTKISFSLFKNNNLNHIIWNTLENKAFIAGYKAKEKVKEDHGSFFIKDKIDKTFEYQFIDQIYVSNDSLLFIGYLNNKNKKIKVPYRFVLYAESDSHLSFEIELDRSFCNRVSLHYTSSKDEFIYGFGEQFTNFNLNGKIVPIFVSEQGIGRGKQPITFIIDLIANSGGDEFTSYAPVPHYISSNLNSVYLKNLEYSIFDFSNHHSISISVFSNLMKGGIIKSDDPLEIIDEYTNYSGRMKPLPDWSQNGAVIGIQGGTKRVGKIIDTLLEKDVPIAGVWLQDWVGQRITEFGKQLWWNWELDQEHYPQWDSLVSNFNEKNIKVLTYINPFLTDVKNKKNHKINYYKIALDSSYFVKDSLGIPYDLDITTFSASLIDLTNPKAKNWYKNLIEENMLSLGVHGWMADFGEALPYYSDLFSGKSGNTMHNYYPTMWSEFNSNILHNLNREDDFLFFSRSGFTQSPSNTSLFWLGDQLVTWDNYDGIKTALTGLLSSGLSGFSLNHSDIGGYTAIKTPVLKYIRSKELFMRWAELNAFTAFFRTHEGNRPEDNHQVYSDDETMIHFAKMAKVYSSLSFYRKTLMKESFKNGYPLIRHPFLHYPNDKDVLNLENEQFMLGSEFMICPVLNENSDEVNCYLPKGNWVHLWTSEEYNLNQKGNDIIIQSPIGMPAVFYKKNSEIAERFLNNLRELNVLN
ncbi:MAG: alpha-glucosidase [Candidatus Marinimicrobia bacterium]|nr:alpha-glucosidase [Candidatus Neomarinimicrobiota bacterium]